MPPEADRCVQIWRQSRLHAMLAVVLVFIVKNPPTTANLFFVAIQSQRVATPLGRHKVNKNANVDPKPVMPRTTVSRMDI